MIEEDYMNYTEEDEEEMEEAVSEKKKENLEDIKENLSLTQRQIDDDGGSDTAEGDNELPQARELLEINIAQPYIRLASASCTMPELIKHSETLKQIFFNNGSIREKSYYG